MGQLTHLLPKERKTADVPDVAQAHSTRPDRILHQILQSFSFAIFKPKRAAHALLGARLLSCFAGTIVSRHVVLSVNLACSEEITKAEVGGVLPTQSIVICHCTFFLRPGWFSNEVVYLKSRRRRQLRTPVT